MIENLLNEWAELQKQAPARIVGDIQKKTGREIAIAESLKQAGYTGELNGFPVQFAIDDRKRAMREMLDNLRSL